MLYVWFDAPIGYISATRHWAEQNNKEWQPYWKSEDTKMVHFIGKDNIVFHSIIWPSMLMGYGAGGDVGAGRGELELPHDIVSREFLTMEGKKFSSRRGVASYVNDFLERYDADALRFFLTAAGPES